MPTPAHSPSPAPATSTSSPHNTPEWPQRFDVAYAPDGTPRTGGDLCAADGVEEPLRFVAFVRNRTRAGEMVEWVDLDGDRTQRRRSLRPHLVDGGLRDEPPPPTEDDVAGDPAEGGEGAGGEEPGTRSPT